MAPPKISIVTPTFNGAATLEETIRSVVSQDYKNWEQIVIDGGSTDATIEILKRYPHLQWISEKDRGHYDAMNKGIARATGDVVAILNSDDLYREGALRHVAAAFEKHADWDGLFGDVVYIDGQSREIFRRIEARYDYDVLRFGNVCYIVHPALFLKKATYDRLGAYRWDTFLNACDVDLILRLGKAGCSIGHVPEFLVDYRLHRHGQSADRRVAENTKREYLAIRKEHGFPGGKRGRLLEIYARLKRQWQKLIYRGRPDIIPGSWFLKGHMQEKTTFSSNIGVDKL